MTPARTFATARRVVLQLRHDPRTIALILVVPCVLVIILRYMLDNERTQFNAIAPMILAVFPLLMMFLVTSIATLRERTTGTLDRLMTTPMSKLDLIFGYGIAFSSIGFIQACLVSGITLGLLDVTVRGGTIPVLLVAVLSAFLGTALGLCVSALATSEFQAVELVMPILIPQILTCGLLVPRASMSKILQWLSDIFPLTYSTDAMRRISMYQQWSSTLTKDLVIIGVYGVGALIIGSVTIQRKE
jgi:ABC-2 type transport system permease protein